MPPAEEEPGASVIREDPRRAAVALVEGGSALEARHRQISGTYWWR